MKRLMPFTLRPWSTCSLSTRAAVFEELYGLSTCSSVSPGVARDYDAMVPHGLKNTCLLLQTEHTTRVECNAPHILENPSAKSHCVEFTRIPRDIHAFSTSLTCENPMKAVKSYWYVSSFRHAIMKSK